MPSPHFTSESPRSIQFKAIRSRTDLANWIGISERTLLYILYRLPDELKYSTFEISKRGGGKRVISAPNKALKYSQKKISEVLYEILPPRKIAKGYVPGAGVYDHAEMHKRRSTIITADIKSFFPSINFGRVRGMFMSPPFALPASVSTMLAQLCCKGGELPQGSPTSPAISNIICRSLDLDLLRFSKNHRISVSRYADDICFSTNNRKPIFSLAASDPQLGIFPGNEISEIFRSNGFTLNLSKFHLSRSTGRQMVTGLIVNDGVNLPRSWRRQLRVILHVRSRMDDKASTEILNSWVSPPASRRGITPSADALIKGKASFATYVDRRSGRKFTESLHRSYPKLRTILPRTTPRFPVRIITEGPTDLVHLRAAIEHFSDRLDLSDTLLKFNNYQGDQGDVETLHTLRRIANVDVDELTIGIFDFDNPKLLKILSISEGEHVRLGRMVFAACLSRPQNVNGQYCIESLYRRSQAVQTTTEGRRLFFSDEFGDDGRMIQGAFSREFPRKSAVVLSERVFDPNNPELSLTLSKTSFASMIEAGTAPFSDMDFSGFLPTLLHLRKMIDEAIMFQRYK